MNALGTLNPYRAEHSNRFGNVDRFQSNAGVVGTAHGPLFIASRGVTRQSGSFTRILADVKTSGITDKK